MTGLYLSATTKRNSRSSASRRFFALIGTHKQLTGCYNRTVTIRRTSDQGVMAGRLHIKDRHFALSGKAWNPNEAKSAIQEIATDAIQNLKSGYLWPSHPLDGDASDHGMYFGTSGVSWALDYLRRNDAVDIEFDLENALTKQLVNCQEQWPNMPHTENASYLFGDFPILMMQYQQSKDNALLDELHKKITVNNSQPTRELMWGSAGTMIALVHLHRWLPDDPRWKETYLVQAKRLIDELHEHKEFGFLWNHDVYGKQMYFLGPMHGRLRESTYWKLPITLSFARRLWLVPLRRL